MTDAGTDLTGAAEHTAEQVFLQRLFDALEFVEMLLDESTAPEGTAARDALEATVKAIEDQRAGLIRSLQKGPPARAKNARALLARIRPTTGHSARVRGSRAEDPIRHLTRVICSAGARPGRTTSGDLEAWALHLAGLVAEDLSTHFEMYAPKKEESGDGEAKELSVLSAAGMVRFAEPRSDAIYDLYCAILNSEGVEYRDGVLKAILSVTNKARAGRLRQHIQVDSLGPIDICVLPTTALPRSLIDKNPQKFRNNIERWLEGDCMNSSGDDDFSRALEWAQGSLSFSVDDIAASKISETFGRELARIAIFIRHDTRKVPAPIVGGFLGAIGLLPKDASLAPLWQGSTDLHLTKKEVLRSLRRYTKRRVTDAGGICPRHVKEAQTRLATLLAQAMHESS